MGWKQNLLGQMNSAIAQKQDAIFAVHTVEQKEWGEKMLENIFSTLHLNKPLKLDFKIIPVEDQDKISVGDILEHKRNGGKPGERVVHKDHGAGEITLSTYIGPKEIFYIKFDSLDDEIIIDRYDPKLKFEYDIKREQAHFAALAEAKEVENLDNEALVEKFERLIREGAGPDYCVVVSIKRELIRRMNRGDHL